MIDDFDDKNRQLIPRWTTFKTSFEISSKSDSREICEIFKPSFEKAVVDWEKNKTIGFAYDVVTFGTLSKREKEKPFIDCLSNLKNTRYYQRLKGEQQSDVLQFFLDVKGINKLIHSNRLLLNSNPNNALLWLDQAYCYFLIGQDELVDKCITMALRLNNSNAFILRSAASFYNHLREPDKALKILRMSDYAKVDPQIIAADISIANANRINTRIKKRITLDISPKSAELFAVYSTLESASGNKKNAKKMMQKALCFPNENIIAQKVSLEKQFGSFSISTPENIPCEFEAKAKLYYYQGNYEQSEKESYNWFFFQPFSVEAATFNSSLNLTYTKDYKRALQVLELADRINANNPSIKNNYAYCLAKLGDCLNARKQLDSVNYSSIDEYMKNLLIATDGFICYKTGERERGISLYKEAIEGFSSLSNPFCVSKATYILGSLEYEDNIEIGKELISKAFSIAEKNNIDYLMTIIRKDGLVVL